MEDFCKEIAIYNGFPRKAIANNSQKYPETYYKQKDAKLRPNNDPDDNQNPHLRLPKHAKFPSGKDPFYPVVYDGVIYDTYELKVIYDQNKTGFAEEGDKAMIPGDLVAGRYRVLS